MSGYVVISSILVGFYSILFCGHVFNTILLRISRQPLRVVGTLLMVFCAVRLAGNAVLLAAYSGSSTGKEQTKLFEAGEILQGLGYSFLFAATLALLTSATIGSTDNGFGTKNRGVRGVISLVQLLSPSKETSPQLKWALVIRVLHLGNLAALVLSLVGYIKSRHIFAQSFDATSDKDSIHLNRIASAGSIVYLALTMLLILPATLASRHVLLGKIRRGVDFVVPEAIWPIMAAWLFLLSRNAFATYVSFASDPFAGRLALRTIFQYMPEVIVNIIYCVALFLLRKLGSNVAKDVNSETESQSKL